MEREGIHIKLIALDLDGTTLNSEGRLPSANKEVLEEVITKGVIVAVASGRAFSAVPEEVLAIKGLRYVISSNGAAIDDVRTGERVYSNCISSEATDNIIAFAEQNGLKLEAFWRGRAYTDSAAYREMEEKGSKYRRREYVLRTRTPLDDMFSSMREHAGEIENVNIFFDEAEDAAAMLPAAMEVQGVTVTSSVKSNIEFGGATTSKSSAIARLAEMNGIKREEIMCCGDAPNDIAMIEYAGVGVAMGNAWGGTKDHADYVTGTNDEAGVAMAVRHFCL